MRGFKTLLRRGSGAACIIAAAAAPSIANAQGTGADQVSSATNESDIIVTARRRTETAQETPVAMTVLNEALLDRYGVKGIATIAQLTPGLFTGESSGSVGGSISLRGVGSGEGQAFIDQAVSINVDGIAISSAQILRAAQLDLKQIEVLRGPQALFFGKNSPGGIISLTSADPGDRLELMARAGYEFRAEEKFVEATVSAPITDTLGIRVAGRYSKMNGYINVNSPPTAGVIPYGNSGFPKQNELFLRGTIAFKPSERLNIHLKGTYTDTNVSGYISNFSDVVSCPYGVPQESPLVASNCRNDATIVTAQLPAAFLALNPLMGSDPNGFRKNRQALVTANVAYEINDALNITSVTGFYGVRERFTGNGSYGLGSVLGYGVRFSNEQLSQELRLASSFDGPLNFVLGGFFENRKLYTETFIGFPINLGQRPVESTHQRQLTYSAFGQLLWDVNDKIQLAAGGRYTQEEKRLLDYVVTPVGGAPVDVSRDPRYPGTSLTFDNFSPEITLTYKPTTDLMLFASYKQGYKSGGFDGGYTAGAILANPARDQSFDPEKVRGVEAGIKSSLAGRQVTLNLTGYWYDYRDLQVTTFDNQAQAFTTQNAAKARVRGIELETRYRPNAVPGLNFHVSGSLNDAKYREYLSDCYVGQSQAQGCNQTFNAGTGLFTAQQLAGQRLRKAPVFAATFGGYYEHPVASNLMMSLSADGSYSSSYIYGLTYQPAGRQSAFAKLDATFRVFSEDKRWELALLGRNLTNKLNLVNGLDRTATGGAKGSAQPACGTLADTGCQRLADIVGTPAMPRTVTVQLTVRY